MDRVLLAVQHLMDLFLLNINLMDVDLGITNLVENVILNVAGAKFGTISRVAVYQKVADLAEEKCVLAIKIEIIIIKNPFQTKGIFYYYKRFQVVPIGVSSKIIPEAFNSSRIASAFAHSLFFLASIRA